MEIKREGEIIRVKLIPFKKELLSLIKSIEGRKYNKETLEWTLPASKEEELNSRFKEYQNNPDDEDLKTLIRKLIDKLNNDSRF